MRHIKSPFDFANQGNWPAGSDFWASQPRKATLVDSQLAAGFGPPDTPVAVEEVNAMFSFAADAQAIQCHSALRNWRSALHLLDGTARTIVAARNNAASLVNAPNDKQRLPRVFGIKAADSNKTYQAASPDGSTWAAIGKTTGTGFASGITYLWAEPGGPGTIALSEGVNMVVSSDLGNSWALNNDYVVTNVLGFYWDPSTGTYYAVQTSNGKVVRGPTYAAGTTSSLTPVVATGVTSFNSVASGNYAEFASDTNGNVVFICRANGNTFFSAFRSNDGGASWAKTQDLGGTSGNITYNEARGLFFMTDTAGGIYASADGATWNTHATTGLAFHAGPHSLASCGPALVVLSSTGPLGYWGIVYTFDLGATWHKWDFSIVSLNELRNVNGRLLVISDTSIWQCGQLSAPAADLVV